MNGGGTKGQISKTVKVNGAEKVRDLGQPLQEQMGYKREGRKQKIAGVGEPEGKKRGGIGEKNKKQKGFANWAGADVQAGGRPGQMWGFRDIRRRWVVVGEKKIVGFRENGFRHKK